MIIISSQIFPNKYFNLQIRQTPVLNVLNIKEDEAEITYPLLLIHGTIESDTNLESYKEVTLSLKNGTELFEIKSNVKESQYKILIELQLGNNEITLLVNNLRKRMQINFKPRPTTYIVAPLYVICDEQINGNFQAPKHENNSIESAFKRINTSFKILQCLIAEKLNELDLGRKTFETIPCELFKTKLTVMEANAMKQEELWEYLAREIMLSEIGDERKKYVAFLSFTRYHGEYYDDDKTNYDDLLKITSSYVALGGGGLAIFGTACLYTWPESSMEILDRFQNKTLVNRKEFLDDSCYRNTECGCFSTTLGSVLHELCHTFDLGHTDNGIMGRGFDFIEKTFTEMTDIKECLLKTSTNSIRNYKFSTLNVIDKPVKANEIYFTKSSASLLSYHRWFNNYKDNNLTSKDCLIYDNRLKLIKSRNGIRVIEIRSIKNELVLFNWLFTGKVLKYSFLIPTENEFPLDSLVIIIDNMGIILKDTF